MTDHGLRRHLLDLLHSADAHITWEDAVADFPVHLRGVKPPGAPHTAWQLLEHLRICVHDIVEFTRNPQYACLEFPAGYWPLTEAPPDEAAWERSIAAMRADTQAMCALVAEESRDLYARINHPDAEDKHSLLREALLVADHNAYHTGQLVLLRRLLGSWP
jgi:uncharacterized damage-inducible protein DinB